VFFEKKRLHYVSSAAAKNIPYTIHSYYCGSVFLAWRAFLKRPETLRARKAVLETLTRLLCKGGLFICFKRE